MTEKQYEVFDGRNYAILWRDNAKSECDPCPFCGREHRHGIPDGHRLSHCPNNAERGFTASDGTDLYARDGYIVRTRKDG